MIFDYFNLALRTLAHRKMRSLLTVLGIVIGITAVVALISLGKGLQVAINQQFNAVGTNRVVVQPGSAGFAPPSVGTGSAKITDHDLALIKKIDGVKSAFGFLLEPGKMVFNGKVGFQYVIGIPDDIKDLGTVAARFDIMQGRQLKPGDKNKALIGYDLAYKDEVFGKPIGIGSKIVVENKTFDVVGIRKKLGDPANDNSVTIPIETLKDIFNIKDKLAMINIEVDNEVSPDIVAEKIKKELRKDRHQKEGEEDFQIQTSAELISSFNTVLNIVQAVLIGIAAISLLVGGIGIMNTMYTSVLERTKDIGILKSIGAKDSDILLLFLIESGFIGLIGGIVGILIGVGIGRLVEFVAMQIWGSPLIRADFPIYLIIGSLLFSFVIGSFAGLLPARQAAKMNPVDALRYE